MSGEPEFVLGMVWWLGWGVAGEVVFRTALGCSGELLTYGCVHAEQVLAGHGGGAYFWQKSWAHSRCHIHIFSFHLM